MDVDIRLEDYGKTMISQLPIASKEDVINKMQEVFVKNLGTKYYLLLSKEVDYYTVLKVSSQSPAQNMYEFLLDSSFQKQDTSLVPMTDVQYIEIREDGGAEIWIGGTYFHFTPFDWGVEEV